VLVRDRVLVGGALVALLMLGLAAWLLLMPPDAGQAVPGIGDGPPQLETAVAPAGTASASTGETGETIVVDVEGGVAQPGVRRLPAGARVADAIAAAGGYDASADLVLAARALNLATLLSDGQQVYVPMLGDPTGAGQDGSGASGAGGGPLNLNTASETALDALPGIGPVTVGKIVAARAEQPFRTLDELVTRKVLTAAQLDKIRDLVVVG
jgi:competence protein ComEA